MVRSPEEMTLRRDVSAFDVLEDTRGHCKNEYLLFNAAQFPARPASPPLSRPGYPVSRPRYLM
jgi:hypothetical protein